MAIDLAVEVISKGNTKPEMVGKLREYFEAGTRLVWFVYPITRTIRVFTSPTQSTLLDRDGVLDGGDVRPGFSLPIRELFARAERGPDA